MRIYSDERKFYVYQYLRNEDTINGQKGTPYYIGKGSGRRAFIKNRKSFRPPKDRSRIQIISENLTEKEAFKLEVDLIAQYGRIDKGTGCLYNKTNGGDGASGYIQSQDQIEKIKNTKIKNGTLNNVTPESIAKCLETKRINGTMNTGTLESRARTIETKRKNNTLGFTSEATKKGLKTKRKNGSLNNHTTPIALHRQRETKIKNNTLPSSSIVKAKVKATKIKNNTLPSNPTIKEKTLNTKIKNNTLGFTSEATKKGLKTKRKNGTNKRSPESIAKFKISMAKRKALKENKIL